jgi:L-arabinose 1- dehydrogenase
MRLAYVSDPDPERLIPFQRRGVPTSPSVLHVIEQPAVDALLICTPPSTHHELALVALNAGKHVCCEKPLATSAEDAAELVDRAVAVNRVLFTLFHRRYNRNVRGLRPPASRLVGMHADYLEDIREHAGDATWYWSPADAGGGCIADNGPNVFDVVRTLVGAPEPMSARVRRENGVDMHATIECRAPGDVPVTIELDWRHAGPERKTVTLRYTDGSRRELDMLHGFTAFKSSLPHEYVVALRELGHRIAASRGSAPPDLAGLDAARWVDRVCAIAQAVAPAVHPAGMP